MVQAVCNISNGTVAPHAAIEALNDWGGFTQHAFASLYKEGAVMANASSDTRTPGHNQYKGRYWSGAMHE